MISKVRGTQDIMPARFTDKVDAQIERWLLVERTAREAFRRYGFEEIRTPVIERTELFERGVGTETDVNKEMYTFEDRDGEKISLRPESTASVVRAYIEQGMFNTAGLTKLFYIGPQFRRERPQKGRYRQFSQVGVEVLGQSDDPAIEAEVIEMLDWYLKQLGITETELFINSIGDENCRPRYIETLKNAIKMNLPNLCESCRRRHETNPLRVLDCKVPSCQSYLEGLPVIYLNLCQPCWDHFERFRNLLDKRGINYMLEGRLVRGLDYYKRTTFEIIGKQLGAQNTIVGGGRYDGLSEMIGGPPIKGFGFAFGVERMVMSIPDTRVNLAQGTPDLFIAYVGKEAQDQAFALAKRLRQGKNAPSIIVDLEGRKLKKALAIANSIRARYALIISDTEIASSTVLLRNMQTGDQRRLDEDTIEKGWALEDIEVLEGRLIHSFTPDLINELFLRTYDELWNRKLSQPGEEGDVSLLINKGDVAASFGDLLARQQRYSDATSMYAFALTSYMDALSNDKANLKAQKKKEDITERLREVTRLRESEQSL